MLGSSRRFSNTQGLESSLVLNLPSFCSAMGKGKQVTRRRELLSGIETAPLSW